MSPGSSHPIRGNFVAGLPKTSKDEVALGPGDPLLIPADKRHRVTWTRPGATTIRLAVHLGP